ncbi:MAG: hypothetical protein RQ751_08865 [Longimicrobiales bacterium]|nr:hypothetical protein [Longimicrobiales bacterium]
MTDRLPDPSAPDRTHGPAGRLLLALALGLTLGACGNLTAGGLAETEVTVSGDASDPVQAAAGARHLPPVARQTADDDEAEGELEADITLFLEGAGGSPVALTPQPVIVDVDIRGVVEQQVVAARVPAGRYTALRMVFRNVEVEVEGGLIVDGGEVVGLVEVEFEADSLTVVEPVSLSLEDGDRVQILLDLNAQDWLRQVDPQVGLVPETFFANAITVRVR